MNSDLVDLTDDTAISLDVSTSSLESPNQKSNDASEEDNELLELITSQIEDVSQQIQDLSRKRQALEDKRNSLLSKLSGNGFGSTSELRNTKSPSSNSLKQMKDTSIEKWSGPFEWSQEVENLAKSYFAVRSFRFLQREVLNATISGKDCFVVMPTGAGKSLCYQLPALFTKKKITLVISPLLSLIQDQVMQMQVINVSAEMITSFQSKEQTRKIMNMIDKPTGNLSLLYVTPEKIAKSKTFISKLEKAYRDQRLARIIVDEAHCCSQWGHDFRPDYSKLGVLKQLFPDVPIMALTATATTKVIDDVKKMLGIPRAILFKTGFNRDNLYYEGRVSYSVVDTDPYEVRRKPSQDKKVIKDMVDFIKTNHDGESGIVYCFSRKESEEVAESLREEGIIAECYHAQVPNEEREGVHRRWSSNKTQVVVATVAFGMGINKPDVRFVIHFSLSKSLEGYYQESGRAGRDGRSANCILYYRGLDGVKMSQLTVPSNGVGHVRTMMQYAEDISTCRRVTVSRYFDEKFSASSCNETCDVCRNKRKIKSVDITSHALNIVRALSKLKKKDSRFTLLQMIDFWRGTGKKAAEFKDCLESIAPKEFSKEECERILSHLIIIGVLDEEFNQTAYSINSYLKLGSKGQAMLRPNSGLIVTMDFLEDDSGTTSGKQTLGKKKKGVDEEDLRRELKEIRAVLSAQRNCYPHMVLDENNIEKLLEIRPQDGETLTDILGAVKGEQYGEEILKVLNKFPIKKAAKKRKLKNKKSDEDDAEEASVITKKRKSYECEENFDDSWEASIFDSTRVLNTSNGLPTSPEPFSAVSPSPLSYTSTSSVESTKRKSFFGTPSPSLKPTITTKPPAFDLGIDFNSPPEEDIKVEEEEMKITIKPGKEEEDENDEEDPLLSPSYMKKTKTTTSIIEDVDTD